ncbi:MAG: hypothetical protein KJ852_08420 [Gammaproteobacteria bacterium]|nr:hypothetical protein [Gammaproteobacteria bacterium]MBU0786220.1 hypothetical protein [Gammaproteobacteria bacterium]MBU0816801.1 hypothetical protein [Gammaproteobacteria bacterium]MBU1786965.1 hypothetical protein [Gammaproteobacteria bacterium]
MKSLGLLEFDRLALIPPAYWPHHEFCFYLHDQMLELLVQYEASGAHQWVTSAFDAAAKEYGTSYTDIDILELLRQKELVPYYRHHIVSHLVLGLAADMLHFLYESLMCFEKRKFSVAYALLRKPLKENLLFLSWLLGNENDFITRFEKDNYSTLNGLNPERRTQIFTDAISRLPVNGAFAADLLEKILFSKVHARSFEPIWQRATHLITSQGTSLRTEDLNINFIFHDASADESFEHLYKNLPYVMLYAVQVSLECFARVLPSNEHTTSHLILTSLGAYECLFERKQRAGITAMLGRHLKPFLKCIHCASRIRLTRQNAIDMYLRERLTCHKCGLESPLPLYWLFAQANITVKRTSETTAILGNIIDSQLAQST